jgi:hypothetical protein
LPLLGVVALAACDRILGVDGEYQVAASAGPSSSASGSGAAGGAGAGGSGGSGGAEGGSGGAGGHPLDCTPDDPGPFADGAVCPLDMVDAGAFCIDAREATFAQYLDVVDGHALDCFEDNLLGNQTCLGNEPFNIEETDFRAAPAEHPAHPLDYCDAEAYCRLSGRELCTSLEWREACSPEGAPFPWRGGAAGQCIEWPGVEAVDRMPNTCRRVDALSEVTDMVGNVAEHAFFCPGDQPPCGPCTDTSSCLAYGARPNEPNSGPDSCGLQAGAPYRTGLGSIVVDASLRTGVRCCYHPAR